MKTLLVVVVAVMAVLVAGSVLAESGTITNNNACTVASELVRLPDGRICSMTREQVKAYNAWLARGRQGSWWPQPQGCPTEFPPAGYPIQKHGPVGRNGITGPVGESGGSSLVVPMPRFAAPQQPEFHLPYQPGYLGTQYPTPTPKPCPVEFAPSGETDGELLTRTALIAVLLFLGLAAFLLHRRHPA